MFKKRKVNIQNLFDEKKVLNVSAPMVRYSKLQFRNLVRLHNVDLCFTPMIIADSFCRSEKARQNEFTTETDDVPVVVQYATDNADDFVAASQMVYPYADGVDLNCGCPQKWAMQDGYGCALLSQSHLIQDMVSSIRNKLPHSFSVSVKIRLLSSIRETVELCRQLERCGVTFITIHGRTPSQKCEPVNEEAFIEVKKSISVPLIVNGDIKHLDDAEKVAVRTNCNGVMAGRGLLINPSLFDGTNKTSVNVVQEWLNICNAAGDDVTFQTFHHHLVFMLEKVLPRRIRSSFNNLQTKMAVIESLAELLGIYPETISSNSRKVDCDYNDSFYKSLQMKKTCQKCSKIKYNCCCSKPIYDLSKNGKYFKEVCDEDSDGDMDLGITLFNE